MVVGKCLKPGDSLFAFVETLVALRISKERETIYALQLVGWFLFLYIFICYQGLKKSRVEA
jgi:hypothetical protein